MSNEELPNDFGQAKHLIDQSIHMGEIRKNVAKLKEQGASEEEQAREYLKGDMSTLVQEISTFHVLKELMELAGFPRNTPDGFIAPAWEGYAMNLQGMVDHPKANAWRHLVLKKDKKVSDILDWILQQEEMRMIAFTNEIPNLDYDFFEKVVLTQKVATRVIIARDQKQFDEKKAASEADAREMLKKNSIDPDNPELK